MTVVSFFTSLGPPAYSERLRKAYQEDPMYLITPEEQKEDIMLLVAWNCGRKDMHRHLISVHLPLFLFTGFLLAILALTPVRRREGSEREVCGPTSGTGLPAPKGEGDSEAATAR